MLGHLRDRRKQLRPSFNYVLRTPTNSDLSASKRRRRATLNKNVCARASSVLTASRADDNSMKRYSSATFLCRGSTFRSTFIYCISLLTPRGSPFTSYMLVRSNQNSGRSQGIRRCHSSATGTFVTESCPASAQQSLQQPTILCSLEALVVLREVTTGHHTVRFHTVCCRHPSSSSRGFGGAPPQLGLFVTESCSRGCAAVLAAQIVSGSQGRIGCSARGKHSSSQNRHCHYNPPAFRPAMGTHLRYGDRYVSPPGDGDGDG